MKRISLIIIVFLFACKKNQPQDSKPTIIGNWHTYQIGEKYYLKGNEVFNLPLDTIPKNVVANALWSFLDDGSLLKSTDLNGNLYPSPANKYSFNADTLTVFDGGAVYKYAVVFIDNKTLSLTQPIPYNPPTKSGFTKDGVTTEFTFDLFKRITIYKKR